MQKPHTPFEQGQGAGELPWEQCSTRARKGQMGSALSAVFFCFPPIFFFWVTGELSTLRQMMKVPNEPGLSPNNGLENAFLSDQSMASNPRKGQPERFGAKTTSHDGKAGHLLTHVCHRARQEQRQVRPCKRRSSQSYVGILPP